MVLGQYKIGVFFLVAILLHFLSSAVEYVSFSAEMINESKSSLFTYNIINKLNIQGKDMIVL